MSNSQYPTIERRSSSPSAEETSFYNNLARLMSWSQPRTDPKLKRILYDATTFIAIVSELEIDLFTFTWYSGMGELGRGKTAQIQQSVINLETEFAFKRFTFPGSEEPDEAQIIRAAMIEILALSHPALRDHQNILKLHGVCWEISSENLFRPVLVVEKTSLGDLGRFMSEHGSAVDGNTRVEMCVDVIRAVAILHINDIIHGDIKPQNFLVFQEETGEYYLKLGDFGFSSLASSVNEDTKIALPISWPWSAPELSNKQYGLSLLAAKRTDVYSVGLVCWWLMLGEKHLDDSQNPWSESYEWISVLKDSNELMVYARSKIDELEDVDQEMRSNLLKLFQFTTMSLSDERIPRLTIFLPDVPAPSRHQPFEQFPMISVSTPRMNLKLVVQFLQIRKAFGTLMRSSIELRQHIISCLRNQLMDDFEAVQRSNAAFQLAVCYCIGFGAPEDDGNVQEWLDIAGQNFDVLQVEIELIRTRDTDYELQYKSDYLAELTGAGFFSQKIHTDRARSDAREKDLSLSRELRKMQQILIPSDYVLICLQRELSIILQAQGYYSRARSILWETLQFMENDQDYGLRHPRTLVVAADVLNLLQVEGEYGTGMELGERNTRICQEVFGDHDLRTASSQIKFARILELKERYKSSEDLHRRALNTQRILLGKRHPVTLATMHGIGHILSSLSRHEEASDILYEVCEGDVDVLGLEHPHTLITVGSLASLLLETGQHWQAERLFRMQAAGIRDHYGEDHSDLPSIMQNLAMAITAQERYDEAENIIREVLAKAEPLFLNDHRDTLIKRSNLALILSRKREYGEAETILRELVPKQQATLGRFHSLTLVSKTRLALAVRNQGRLEEAKDIQSEILNSSNDSTSTFKDQYQLLKVRIHLGRTLQLMGESEAAIQEVHTALEGQAATLGDDHSDAYAILDKLSNLLQQEGFLPEAVEYHAAAVSKCEATLGESHIKTLTAVYWLASHWMLDGRFSEADAHLQRVYRGIVEVKGEEHWSAQRARCLLEGWKKYMEQMQQEADEEAPSDAEP
ncbi:MAG: hypothetical protein Q9161_001951 [Pseudevernia consocians]